MTGYVKLFGSIVASTIWREDNTTRIIWITMLALANADGVVEASIPGLADLARVSIEDAVAALKKLSSPDTYSRSKEHEGRRIKEVDGGWLILNHAKYREKMSHAIRQEYKRKWDRDNRNNRPNASKRAKQDSTPDKTPDNPRSNPTNPTQAEAEAEAEAERRRKSVSRFIAPSATEVEAELQTHTDKIPEEFAVEWSPKSEAEKFVAFYGSKGWIVGKAKMRSWKQATVTWRMRWIEDKRANRTREFKVAPDKIIAALQEAIDNHICNPKNPRHELEKSKGLIDAAQQQWFATLTEKLKRRKKELLENA